MFLFSSNQMWRAGGHSSRSDSEKMSNIRLQVLIFRNIGTYCLSVCILDSIILVTLVMSLWVQIRDFARFDCHVNIPFYVSFNLGGWIMESSPPPSLST